MGRTKHTVRDKTSFKRRQQVEAALRAGVVAATGLLAILPRELLRLVIAAVVKARDARQLERLGATCKALWALCREEAPWQALLMAHFDVDHPDAYPILDGANAPREHLMWLVGEARDLTREYAENDFSNLPFAHRGIHHDAAKILLPGFHPGMYTDWLASLANRIQLARGGSSMSSAERGQFRSSALYRELSKNRNSASALVSYGHWMRLIVVNKYAKNALGCTDEEVSISTWVTRKTFAHRQRQVDRVEPPEPDYDVMQDWTRQKLEDIARPGYLAMVDDLRALVRKHDLGGEPAFRRMLAAARREPCDERELEEDRDIRRRMIPSLCERPIATTKLLAGLHGGLFVYDQTFDEAGSYWFSTMFCLADRDAVIHEVEED